MRKIKLSKKVFFIVTLFALSYQLMGAQTLYTNAKVYTVESSNIEASNIIVEDNKFKFIGSSKEAKKLIGSKTKIVDLEGKLVLPAFYDSHLHPIGAGENLLYKCNFPQEMGFEDVLKKIQTCVDKAPKGSWILGFGWGPQLLDKVDKKYLDRISTDTPMALTDFSGHNVWVNSTVIEKINISKNDIKKYADLIGRDKNGNINGLLKENAQDLISNSIPTRTKKELDKALDIATKTLNKYGIIGVKDSYVYEKELNTYQRAQKRDELNLRVGLVLGWNKNGESIEDKKRRLLRMKGMENKYLKTNFIKISLDGIPPTKTAALVEPYAHSDGEMGTLEMSQKELNSIVSWADKNGFSTMAHTSGDRAVRVMLNAIENARKTNGNSGLQHELAHACMVHNDDIGRFKELNAVANFSPFFWYPSPIHDGMKELFGSKRAEAYCAGKKFMEDGTNPTYGTDWPVVADVNPWPALESLVTRANPFGERIGEAVWKEQALSVKEALKMFTIYGAKAQGIEDKSGSIKAGKTADFIVLNQNILSVNPSKISDTKVLMTVFDGKIIYNALKK